MVDYWTITQEECVARHYLPDSILSVTSSGTQRLWFDHSMEVSVNASADFSAYDAISESLVLISATFNSTLVYSTSNRSLTLMQNCSSPWMSFVTRSTPYFISNGSVYLLTPSSNGSLDFVVWNFGNNAAACDDAVSNLSIPFASAVSVIDFQLFGQFLYLYNNIGEESSVLELNPDTLQLTQLILPHSSLQLLHSPIFIGYRVLALSVCTGLSGNCGPCRIERQELSETSPPLITETIILQYEDYDIQARQTVQSAAGDNELYFFSYNENCNNFTVDLIRVDSDLNVVNAVTWVSKRRPNSQLYLDIATNILYVTITTSSNGVEIFGFSTPDLVLVSDSILPYAAVTFSDNCGMVLNGAWY